MVDKFSVGCEEQVFNSLHTLLWPGFVIYTLLGKCATLTWVLQKLSARERIMTLGLNAVPSIENVLMLFSFLFVIYLLCTFYY